MSLARMLDEGQAALGLGLSAVVQARLLHYLALLSKWNKTYNLTAIRDEREMVTQHLLDSLAVLPMLKKSALATRRDGALPGGQRWADVGSGAGLPGIPLAIVCPEIQMTLIEAVEKKSAFQRQVKIELGLTNVAIAASRVEHLSAASFDAVISRAFAELSGFAALSGHLLVPGGCLYAMKGHATAAELNGLPAEWCIRECSPVHVPGLDAQRHLIVIEKA